MGNPNLRQYTKLHATMAARDPLEKSAKGVPAMNCHPIRIILLGTATVLSPVALFAQSDPMAPPASSTTPNLPGQAHPSTTSIQESTGMSSDASEVMKDKMFLRKAAAGGMAEVQLGQLATQKAGAQDVKDFGQKMVTDHTALNNEMGLIADSMGVTLPKKLNKEDQAEYDKLNALSGDDFDKEYVAFMVKDHHQDLREFRTEAASTSDPTLKAAVDKGSKVIYEHMIMIDKMAREKGIATPGRNGGRPATPPSQ
jgi:putative membrane protein